METAPRRRALAYAPTVSADTSTTTLGGGMADTTSLHRRALEHDCSGVVAIRAFPRDAAGAVAVRAFGRGAARASRTGASWG